MASILGTPASFAATFGLVGRFLDGDDHRACRAASKAVDGLYADCMSPSPDCSGHVRRQIVHAITRYARTLQKKVRWPQKVVAALANDLFLVVTGVRIACLVDCAAIPQPRALALLAALREELMGCDHVRAVYLDDDLFFVHARRLSRSLVTDVASLWAHRLCIDVTPSASSSTSTAPTILTPPPALSAFATALVTALTWSTAHHVLALTPLLQRFSQSAIAVAGLLLDYPVLYWHVAPHSLPGNTLGLQPLVLYTVTIDVDGAALAVAQFSAPQALHDARVLRARCRRRTSTGHVLHVVSTTCVLPRVSL
ncbi:hypothetical protein SDRG_05501 [Saprolegnia diclina VS20]|uniref:Uncharacterized protein n=1 Tax=Saprolegnia diclina (strain VS20) TaxID=1156394 RepID=T0S3F2_SAPDV|nr:hypothetical protein SDRG_05501 [Saprolegnia diclina VS20]EQC37277.1 hypothetical protein SDRG_05501 [Saprolegnia diclina VS20]|eukprot:XP_008609439.1 hypothetical protein SDRG_05501 [Saprolegnia diclina VS20]